MTERLVPNDYRKFDANELTFSETLEKRNGYFFSETVPGKGGNASCIQTPKMKCVKVGTDYIDLEFPEKHTSFYRAVIQTDNVVKETYASESEKWTKKQASEEKVNEDFRSSVIVPTELKGMPFLRVYLPPSGSGGDSQFSISNQNGDELTLSHLEPGLDTVCILEMKGIRMKKNYVTPYWEVIQARVYTNKRHRQPVGKYAFLDDLVSVKPGSGVLNQERDSSEPLPQPQTAPVGVKRLVGVPEEGIVEEAEDPPRPAQPQQPKKVVRYSTDERDFDEVEDYPRRPREETMEVPETPRKKYVSPPPSPRKKGARFLSRATDSDLEDYSDESD